ncbi:MAG TPA: DUF983 domain-containing protein, partial [Acidimicrobiales bacterium]|nr:DUF983 domain-containing protein [Acidimicrobiales bacterium]
ASPHVPTPPTPSPGVMLVRGVLRRCPNCGGGKLFRGWWTMKERCPRCGMNFEREEGFFLGAYVVNFGLVLALLAVYILVGVILTVPDPPVGWLSAGGMLGSAAVALVFYPSSKTVWSAIDLLMTPLSEDEQARAELEVTDGVPPDWQEPAG